SILGGPEPADGLAASACEMVAVVNCEVADPCPGSDDHDVVPASGRRSHRVKVARQDRSPIILQLERAGKAAVARRHPKAPESRLAHCWRGRDWGYWRKAPIIRLRRASGTLPLRELALISARFAEGWRRGVARDRRTSHRARERAAPEPAL